MELYTVLHMQGHNTPRLLVCLTDPRQIVRDGKLQKNLAPPTFARSLGESLGFMPYFLISAASCSSSILSGGGLGAAMSPEEAYLARSHRLPAGHLHID